MSTPPDMAIRKNPDGSVTVGLIREEKAPEKAPEQKPEKKKKTTRK